MIEDDFIALQFEFERAIELLEECEEALEDKDYSDLVKKIKVFLTQNN